ncbi:MAG TPA: DUF998 domain-containing protein [Thermoplasmata archaeon]|nr:DUF998 domain-containing protein [Thermoplasmata archaeon]
MVATEAGANVGPSTWSGTSDPRWLFWVVIGGILLYIVLDVLAQLLPPHYSPITQAESDLAVGPFGVVMTLNFVDRGVLSIVFVYALVGTVRRERRGWAPLRSGVAFLSIWTVGAFLLAVFPTDVPNLPLSGHGAIHLVAALLAFFGGAVGVFALADHFGESESLRPAKGFALPFAILVVVLFVVEITAGFAVPRIADQYRGLTERLFLGSVLAWIFAISVYLVRRPLPAPGSSTADRSADAPTPSPGS